MRARHAPWHLRRNRPAEGRPQSPWPAALDSCLASLLSAPARCPSSLMHKDTTRSELAAPGSLLEVRNYLQTYETLLLQALQTISMPYNQLAA